MIFDVGTKKWELLVHATAGYFSWSRDGKYIYFDTWLENELALYKVRFSDRRLEQIVGLKNLRRTWVIATTPNPRTWIDDRLLTIGSRPSPVTVELISSRSNTTDVT